MRNVFKHAEQGKKHLSLQSRDLSAGEIKQILDKYKGLNTSNFDFFDLIGQIYYFGVETGYRQAIANQKKR